MPLKITTNNVPRPLVDDFELSASERADFDYLNWEGIDEGIDSATFFRYKGQLYDLSNFMRISHSADPGTPNEFKGWDGYSADTAFSGILVKIVDEESVIVGWYYEKG